MSYAQIFKSDLEKLNIKKYEEGVTEEHIKEMYERKNELSIQSRQLLDIFQENTETLKKVLDEVAKNETIQQNKDGTKESVV